MHKYIRLESHGTANNKICYFSYCKRKIHSMLWWLHTFLPFLWRTQTTYTRNRSLYLNWLPVYSKNTMKCCCCCVRTTLFPLKNIVLDITQNYILFSYSNSHLSETFAQEMATEIEPKTKKKKIHTFRINHFKFNGKIMCEKPRRDLNED